MFSSNTTQVAASAASSPQALDFVTNAYTSKATDWTGNADGKTLTFSFWIWNNYANWQLYSNGNSRVVINISTSGISAYFKNTSDVTIASVSTGNNTIPNNTWTHVMFSIDTANSAACKVYINDIETGTAASTSNANIDMASTGTIYVPSGSPASKVRLSNFFMSKTFYDLTNVTNRRLFITADLKPTSSATQSALTPLVYLPWTDPTTPAVNSGTGGNPTLTGTVVTSGRGPNQYNAPYSTFDGSSTYLYKASNLTGLTDGKTFTLRATFIGNTSAKLLFTDRQGTTESDFVFDSGNASNGLSITCRNSAHTQVLNAKIASPTVYGRNYIVVMSFDLSDTAKRKIFVNGVDVTSTTTFSVYTNANIGFTTTDSWALGASYSGSTPNAYFNGKTGAFYFDNTYIDLSSPANLAKFVSGTGIDAVPVDLGVNGELPTGTSPIVYLPLNGNNPGKNFGTGGDFTVSTTTLAGARGPNEFWGNKANFNNAGDLTKTSALTGASNSKTFSLGFWFNRTNAGPNLYICHFTDASDNSRFEVYLNGSAELVILGYNAAGTLILNATTTGGLFTTGTWKYFQICLDMSNTAKRFVYVDGTDVTMTWTTYTNDSLNFAASKSWIGGGVYGYFYGLLSEFYLTTDYIDFDVETNRLKFRDTFGYPTNLPSAITALSVPNPAIYMRFDPSSFGTNSGTGGNYTVAGTITDGGQL